MQWHLDTVSDDWLPNAPPPPKPVFEVMDGGPFDVLVKRLMFGARCKEDILISVEDMTTLIVDVVESNGKLASSSNVKGFSNKAVDCIIT